MAQDFSEQLKQEVLARDDVKNGPKMNHSLQQLARHRAREISAALYNTGGAMVRSRPFRGMILLNRYSERNVAPKLLGSYEQELHPIIERCIETPYDCVKNIGCGDGYYAIRMARRMTNCEITAYELREDRQELTRDTAVENGVRDRISIAGEYGAEELSALAGKYVLIICDIEGGKRELLDPEAILALKGFDIIVELQEVMDRVLPEETLARFSESHDIERLGHQERNPNAFEELQKASQLDQWLALWEGRQGPTPWAFMRGR